MSGRGPRWITGIDYYEENFVDNTWEQIIRACQRKEVPTTWKSGDQKAMTINGTDYPIDIIGLNHDDYADGSGKAPITFQMHDCYETGYAMNSDTMDDKTKWSTCEMRTTHLPAILALMPTEVQNAIQTVMKSTGKGGYNNGTTEDTEDKLFLLSEREVFGKTSYSRGDDTTQYDYYKAGNSAAKNQNGSPVIWWERSACRDDYGHCFCAVREGAGFYGGSHYYKATLVKGVPFGFCF